MAEGISRDDPVLLGQGTSAFEGWIEFMRFANGNLHCGLGQVNDPMEITACYPIHFIYRNQQTTSDVLDASGSHLIGTVITYRNRG